MEIIQNREQSRFEIVLDGHYAFVEYKMKPESIVFIHTEVPKALAGRGVGYALAKFVLEFARTSGLRVVPYCPFIRAYIARHPEYEPLTLPLPERNTSS